VKTVVRAAAVLAAATFVAPLSAQVEVDPTLPSYRSTGAVSGSLKTVGSDTMNNELALWAEAFNRVYPNVKIEIEGKGSSTAPPALIKGTASFGPMSRAMKGEEVDEFVRAFGYEPIALETSIDMLAVYVHKDNPVARTGLTLQQVDAIFSKNRTGGYPTDIKTWGDVGLSGEWADKPISLYGRNSASGTYGYFKKHALFKGDFKASVKEQPGSSSVVQGVATDKAGIGYSGIGYRTADVAAVPLAVAPGEDVVPAEAEFAYSGDYPLARFLYLYVNKKPGEDLDPLRREFARFLFSREGQACVVKDGYLPVPRVVAERTLQRLDIELPEADSDTSGRVSGAQ
jgi:phosphate transport system substrate-binding protein